MEGLNLFFNTEKMKDAYGENICMSLRIFWNFDMIAMVTKKWQGFHGGNICGKLSFSKVEYLKTQLPETMYVISS